MEGPERARVVVAVTVAAVVAAVVSVASTWLFVASGPPPVVEPSPPSTIAGPSQDFGAPAPDRSGGDRGASAPGSHGNEGIVVDVPDQPPPPEEAEERQDAEPPRAAEPEEGEEAPWPVDAAGIQAALHAHAGEIRDCYEGWLLEDPDIAGMVMVEIELSGEPGDAVATVAAATVASDLDHAPMDACVLQVVQGIPFEPPDGHLTFRYPFVFE